MTTAIPSPNASSGARKSLKIGITGGSGRVGTTLRRALAPQVDHIRVIDIFEPAALEANESFHAADITKLPELVTSFNGLDGVVHLAGLPGEANIDEIVRINVVGTTNIYEAAHRARVPRIVLGSSSHVVGLYPRTDVVGSHVPMRPDGIYGLSKCWAELAAGLYFDKQGIRSLVIRIGNALDKPNSLRTLEIWVSPADLAQLVLIGVEHPDIGCTTVYGVSQGGGAWWDNGVAERFGYLPMDRAIDFVTDPLSEENGPLADIARHFQGGSFAARGHDGQIRRR
jgi:uronate dehydrogenase